MQTLAYRCERFRLMLFLDFLKFTAAFQLNRLRVLLPTEYRATYDPRNKLK